MAQAVGLWHPGRDRHGLTDWHGGDSDPPAPHRQSLSDKPGLRRPYGGPGVPLGRDTGSLRDSDSTTGPGTVALALRLSLRLAVSLPVAACQ